MHIIVIRQQTICMGDILTTHYICFAWNPGLPPLIFALLISMSITSNLIKWTPNLPFHLQEDQTMHIIVIRQQTICMGDILTTHYIGFAWNQGLHPLILALLISISINSNLIK